MDFTNQSGIALQLLEMFLASIVQRKMKALNKMFKRTSKKSGVSVSELKKLVCPIARKNFDKFFAE